MTVPGKKLSVTVPGSADRKRGSGVHMVLSMALFVTTLGADALGPGDHTRSIVVDGLTRTCFLHVPPGYDAAKATPLVLVFHGAAGNAALAVAFTGMSGKADEAGFIAAYPNGTGAGPVQSFNAGGRSGIAAAANADDVKFTAALLDDIASVLNVDPKRVFATGISNGGMMCHRLGAELSERIAAIAPVAGTLALDSIAPARPVPVMQFHGTADALVPWGGPGKGTPRFLRFKSVEETIKMWVKADGCPEKPAVSAEPDKADDGTKVVRATYGPGKDGAEVVLFTIEGGGHTWPGRKPFIGFLGKATLDISANDLMWEFFKKHPLK